MKGLRPYELIITAMFVATAMTTAEKSKARVITWKGKRWNFDGWKWTGAVVLPRLTVRCADRGAGWTATLGSR